MMDSIRAIQPVAPAPSIGGVDRPEQTGAGRTEFSDLLNEAIGRVEQYRAKAEEASNGFLQGETEELHQVILAGQRAEIAFETFLQVRNKVVQAYQEVMRMQM